MIMQTTLFSRVARIGAIVGATLTFSLGATTLAHAQLRVEISGVGANQIPIAVAGFADESIAPQQVSAIIKADLQRSGYFKIIDVGSPMSETTAVNYGDWKSRGADALVVGSVQRLADGRFDVRYKLLDTVKSAQLSALAQASAPQMTRVSAHKIADDIYEKLIGSRGAFATRIAYVTKAGREYRLEVADADGEGTQVALRSNEPIISPAWSPDGTKVAYVSFEAKKPVVYVQDLVTRQRTVVANYKGSNSAPSWSPDGRKLAVALSRDGFTQVYVVNADGGDLKRLSNSNGIDTEPQFSADGHSIYFTSDRSGGPQIYKMAASGGDAQRVTFSGPITSVPVLRPMARPWRTSVDAMAASSCLRSICRMVRNCACRTPRATSRRASRRTASTSCMPPIPAGAARWPWSRSMVASGIRSAPRQATSASRPGARS